MKQNTVLSLMSAEMKLIREAFSTATKYDPHNYQFEPGVLAQAEEDGDSLEWVIFAYPKSDKGEKRTAYVLEKAVAWSLDLIKIKAMHCPQLGYEVWTRVSPTA